MSLEQHSPDGPKPQKATPRASKPRRPPFPGTPGQTPALTCKACCSEGGGTTRSPGGRLDSGGELRSHECRCLGVRACLPFSFQSLPVRMLRALWALLKLLNSESNNTRFCYQGRENASRQAGAPNGSCWPGWPGVCLSDRSLSLPSCYHHPQALPRGYAPGTHLLRKQYFFGFPLLRSLGKMTASRPKKRLDCCSRRSLKVLLTPARYTAPRFSESRSSSFTRVSQSRVSSVTGLCT